MVLTRSRTISDRTPRRSARLSGAQPSLMGLHLPDSGRRPHGTRRKTRSNGTSERAGRTRHLVVLMEKRASESRRHSGPAIEPLKREKTCSGSVQTSSRNDDMSSNNAEAKAILAQLEEHYQCPLCLDIIAHPYILSPVNCGHTFCAMCILKWFFAKLHRKCGSWHESVKCPLCRSLLILTPYSVPRQIITAPFAPNRLAESAMKSMIDRLTSLIPYSKETGKRKRTKARTTTKANVRNKPCKSEGCEPTIGAQKPSDGDGWTTLQSWASGGKLRKDWIERVKSGQIEMDRIIASWTTLNAHDLVKLKIHLGV